MGTALVADAALECNAILSLHVGNIVTSLSGVIVSSTTGSANAPEDALGADPELPPLKCQKSSRGARQGSSSTLPPSAPPASTPSTCVEPIPQGSYFVQFLRQHDLAATAPCLVWVSVL